MIDIEQKQVEAWATMLNIYDFSWRWTRRDTVLSLAFCAIWFATIPLAILGY